MTGTCPAGVVTITDEIVIEDTTEASALACCSGVAVVDMSPLIDSDLGVNIAAVPSMSVPVRAERPDQKETIALSHRAGPEPPVLGLKACSRFDTNELNLASPPTTPPARVHAW